MTDHAAPDPRTPFERAVALVAADRNIPLATARAALITESLDWITNVLSPTSTESLTAAVHTVAARLTAVAADYRDEARQLPDEDTDVIHAEHTHLITQAAALGAVGTALHSHRPAPF